MCQLILQFKNEENFSAEILVKIKIFSIFKFNNTKK